MIYYSLHRICACNESEIGAVDGLCITLRSEKAQMARLTDTEWVHTVVLLRRYTASYRKRLEQLPLQMEKYLRYLEVTDEKELSDKDKERKHRLFMTLGKEETVCCQK